MLADDDPIFGKLVERHLTKAGYSVMRTLSGESLLSLLSVSEPTIVILDVNMPGMGGIETCIRARKRLGNTVPILFLSSLDTQDALRACLEAGGNDFIIKDENLASLASRVELWARRRGSLTLEQLRHDALLALTGGTSGDFDPENRVRVLLRQPASMAIAEAAESAGRLAERSVAASGSGFGETERELRLLVGYVVGLVEGWSKRVPSVKLMFLETLVRSLDHLDSFDDDLIEQILENWTALHEDMDFQEGIQQGSISAARWMAGEQMKLPPLRVNINA